jgi:DNA-binding CsgD family transcriptional regulator
VLALFAARDLDRLVTAAFRVLHAAVSCDCVTVLYPSVGDRMLVERDSRGRTFDAAFTRRNAELSPAVALVMANPGIRLLPTRTGLTLSEDALRRTAYYREIMVVQGWRHAVAMCFWEEPAGTFPLVVFSVKRPQGQPDFTDQDLAALERVHTFMQPVVLRLCEQSRARSLSQALAEPFRRADQGIALVNARFEIASTNPAATKFFRRYPRVWSGVRNICRDLRRERAEQLAANAGGKSGSYRHTRLMTGESHQVVRVTMVWPDHNGLSEPSFVVELGSPDSVRDTAVHAPADLTPRERDVAMALADGLSNQEIADRLGRSIHSVKFSLHRAYAKTGATNRAALVALLRSR